MKKVIIAVSAAIILAAGAATCWTMYSGSEDEFFNENLEALMDSETGANTCYKDIHDKDAVRVFLLRHLFLCAGPAGLVLI